MMTPEVEAAAHPKGPRMKTTHAHPRPGQTVTACCGRPPHTLGIGDRLTFRDERVDCGEKRAQDAREGTRSALQALDGLGDDHDHKRPVTGLAAKESA